MISFGLTDAPAIFQAVVINVLHPIIGKFALVYLDDILIFSKNIAEHAERLCAVLQLLREHKLYESCLSAPMLSLSWYSGPHSW